MTNVRGYRPAEEQSDAYRYGAALGKQQVRDRARKILAAGLAAPGRWDFAVMLVTETDLAVDVAIALLEKVPKATATEARPGHAFYAAIAANAGEKPQPPAGGNLVAGTDAWLKDRATAVPVLAPYVLPNAGGRGR